MPIKKIEKVLHKWKCSTNVHQPVITISSQAGSMGRLIAKQLAETLAFDLFDRILINAIAESAEVSARVVDSVEKARLAGIQKFVDLMLQYENLKPDDYLHHLAPILSVIGEHGRAVVVGRGGNFIIPREKRLSVRIIASLEKRIENIARHFDVPANMARRRIINREERRAAFIKRSFHANIDDAFNYDLVINTDHQSRDRIVDIIEFALMGEKMAV